MLQCLPWLYGLCADVFGAEEFYRPAIKNNKKRMQEPSRKGCGQPINVALYGTVAYFVTLTADALAEIFKRPDIMCHDEVMLVISKLHRSGQLPLIQLISTCCVDGKPAEAQIASLAANL